MPRTPRGQFRPRRFAAGGEATETTNYREEAIGRQVGDCVGTSGSRKDGCGASEFQRLREGEAQSNPTLRGDCERCAHDRADPPARHNRIRHSEGIASMTRMETSCTRSRHNRIRHSEGIASAPPSSGITSLPGTIESETQRGLRALRVGIWQSRFRHNRIRNSEGIASCRGTACSWRCSRHNRIRNSEGIAREQAVN